MEEIDFGSWRPSRGAPATLGEVYDAALDAQRKYQNVNAYTRNLMDAYDRVNDEIKKTVGADVINPLNRYRADPGDAMGAPGRSVYDPEIEREDPVRQWERDLDDLAQKHPAVLDWSSLKARPVAEVAKVMKGSEERNADVMQRRGFVEPKDIPVVGRVPVVRDVVGGVANIVKDPVGMGASFAGSLRGAAESPADLLANLGGVSGSAAKSLVKNAIRNGLANAGIQTALEPVAQANRAKAGMEYGWEKAFEDIVGAFGTGAALDLAARPAGRAAIQRFGTQAPDGTFSRNTLRGGWVTDAPETFNLPPRRPKSPDISPELIERARNDDVAAMREIAEKTGIIEQPAVKGALEYAELGGKVDEAIVQHFKDTDVDNGEGLRVLAEVMKDPDRYIRMPEPVRRAEAPLMREEAVALLDQYGERVGQLLAQMPADVAQTVKRALDAGLPQIVPAVRDALATMERDAPGAAARLAEHVSTTEGLVDRATVHGSSNLLEVADALRRTPEAMDSNVPLTTDFVRGARALAQLEPEAYAQVRSGEISPAIAVEVARLVPPELHARVMQDLRKMGAETAAQAREAIPDLVQPARADADMPLSGGAKVDDPAGPEAKAQTERLREENAEALKEAQAPLKERDKVEAEAETLRGAIAKLEEKVAKAETPDEKAFAEIAAKREELHAVEMRLAALNDALLGPPSALFRLIAERAEGQRLRDMHVAINDALRLADQILPADAKVTVTSERLASGGMPLDAMEERGNITLALHALDPAARIGHEGVHVLVSRGLLSPAEVDLLAQAGRESKVFTPETEARYREAYADRANLDRLIAEESAAHFVEARVKAPPEVKSIADRVRALIDRVRNALNGYGFKTADDVRDAILRGDVAQRAARQEWMRGNPEVAPGVTPMAHGVSEPPVSGSPTFRNLTMYAIRAYHGSPHDFDRFSMDKIGTGEGAQAYGHGLYFAENEGVARQYRDALKDRVSSRRFEPKDDIERSLQRYVEQVQGADGATAADLRPLVEYAAKTGRIDASAPAAVDKMIADGRLEMGNSPGHMYEVRIIADPEHFLDWDKPLSQQSAKVREALAPYGASDKAEGLARELEQVYAQLGASKSTVPNETALLRRARALEDQIQALDKSGMSQWRIDAVSDGQGMTQRLRDAGIPGIRYLDQGSRGAGEGSRNFVVFDDKLIEIVSKDGKPVAAQERQEIIDAATPRDRAQSMFALRDAQTGQDMRRDIDALGYYSKALEAAKSLKQAKGTPEQMLAQLKSAGVKQAEIEATGLGAFLDGKKSITRDEVVKYLEDKRVTLTEQRYGSKETDDAAHELAAHMEAMGSSKTDVQAVLLYIAVRSAGDMMSSPPPRVFMDERGIALYQRALDAAIALPESRYNHYSLDPENPTYRETVLHLPPDAAQMESAAQRLYDKPLARLRPFERDLVQRDVAFQSGHFSEPNIVGHMMTSMTTHEGKPVFTIDQIQSDWGQKLRDGGVRDEAKIADLERRMLAAKDRWEEAKIEFDAKNDPRQRARVAEIEYERIKAELNTATAATPGHPLVNTTDQWTTTTLRRAVRQAAEADAEFIAIPSGETVLFYNPGDEHGMGEFYGKIVPKNLRNILQKIDKASPAPQRIDTLDSPSGKTGIGKGFTLFSLTEKVKQSVRDEGQAMFALRDPQEPPKPPLHAEVAMIDRLGMLKDLAMACKG